MRLVGDDSQFGSELATSLFEKLEILPFLKGKWVKGNVVIANLCSRIWRNYALKI